jgi:hypothetical protein
MGKPVSSDVKRVETTGLNTKVNKEVFKGFKDQCAYPGYPMNVVLETFMQQYANGRFKINPDDIMKFKNDGVEVDTLNSSFNKEIYLNFKDTCKANGFFVKHVLTAFMEKFASGNLILEYVSVDEIKK